MIEPMNIARLWKTGRLLAGLTQLSLSRKIGIPQSSVSKYENGSLEPSAIVWFQFCELVGIDAHRSLNQGVIDGKQKFRSGIYQGNLFGVPLRYRMEQSLKIRELTAFRIAAIELLGEESWKEFLLTIGVPDELFFVMDFQVSFNLLFDLFSWTRGEDEELILRAKNAMLRLNTKGVIGVEYPKKKVLSDFLESFRLSRDHYQKAIQIRHKEVAGKHHVTFQVEDWVSDDFEREGLWPYQKYKADSFLELIRSMYDVKSFEIQSVRDELIVSMESA